MEHNIFKEHKTILVIMDIFSLPAFAFAVYIKIWLLAVLAAVNFVTITVGLIKVRREEVADSKHSEEFKRIKKAGENSYEYAYTEYYKNSFDKIHDWEKSEFEDLIWTKYQKGIIKLAYLLPYLKKYDGVGRLQEDLASPSTPDGHKSIITEALEQAAKDKT